MTNRKLLICGIWCAGMCRNTRLMKYRSLMIVWKGSSIHNWNPLHCHNWRKHAKCTAKAKLCQEIIIIIIIIITFITFMPETNHVSRVYSVAAVLNLQFVLHAVLFHTWNMFCTSTLVLYEVCVQCTIWLFFVVPCFVPF